MTDEQRREVSAEYDALSEEEKCSIEKLQARVRRVVRERMQAQEKLRNRVNKEGELERTILQLKGEIQALREEKKEQV